MSEILKAVKLKLLLLIVLFCLSFPAIRILPSLTLPLASCPSFKPSFVQILVLNNRSPKCLSVNLSSRISWAKRYVRFALSTESKSLVNSTYGWAWRRSRLRWRGSYCWRYQPQRPSVWASLQAKGLSIAELKVNETCCGLPFLTSDTSRSVPCALLILGPEHLDNTIGETMFSGYYL